MDTHRGRLYTLRLLDGTPTVMLGAYIDHPITYVVAYKRKYHEAK